MRVNTSSGDCMYLGSLTTIYTPYSDTINSASFFNKDRHIKVPATWKLHIFPAVGISQLDLRVSLWPFNDQNHSSHRTCISRRSQDDSPPILVTSKWSVNLGTYYEITITTTLNLHGGSARLPRVAECCVVMNRYIPPSRWQSVRGMWLHLRRINHLFSRATYQVALGIHQAYENLLTTQSKRPMTQYVIKRSSSHCRLSREEWEEGIFLGVLSGGRW